VTTQIVLWMFPALLVLIFLGFPVAFSMMLTALGFGLYRFGGALVHQLASRVDDIATNYVLGAIPLFIFMGSILERAGIAERLFDALYMWTRRFPGLGCGCSPNVHDFRGGEWRCRCHGNIGGDACYPRNAEA